MATNVRRKVKCPGCGVYFYRDEEENVLIKNRYWHKICYQQFQVKNEKSAQAIIELDNYICKLFDLDYVNARIKKQIKEYVENYHYSYSGILKTLQYFFEIKKNPIEKANGGIGIVPYVYDDAKKYFETIFYAQQLNKDKDIDSFILNEREIKIHSPQSKRKNIKIIDLNLLEGGLDTIE